MHLYIYISIYLYIYIYIYVLTNYFIITFVKMFLGTTQNLWNDSNFRQSISDCLLFLNSQGHLRQSISEGPFQTLHFNTPFQTFWTVHFRQSTSFSSFPTIHFRVRHTIHFKQCKYPLQSVIVSITVSQIAHYIHYKAHYTLSLQNSPLHYRQPISDSRLHSACYSLLHSACYRQPISDSPLHSACYRQPISDHPLQTAHYTQSVTDSPFQSIHFRQSITLSLLQTDSSVTDSPSEPVH